MLARIGAMFERTASVRSREDLKVVLEDVCRTIADVLGYGAVVMNLYRPAFDDVFTAAVVGSEESVNALLGRVEESRVTCPHCGAVREAEIVSQLAWIFA